MNARQLWKSIKDFLEANIVDPKNRHQVSLIHAAELKSSSTGFIGYPYIRITPFKIVNIEKSNNGTKWREFESEIMIYGTDYSTVDKLYDDVLDLLEDNSTHYELYKKGILMYRIINSDIDERTIEGKDVIIKSITIRGWIN